MKTFNISRDHEKLVANLIKDGGEIASNITPLEANLIHSVLGISGESGELLDAIKKHVIYKKELDIENIVEELGDIEFYLANIRKALGLDRDTVLAKNMDKLNKRYPEGSYSNKDAIERKDK